MCSDAKRQAPTAAREAVVAGDSSTASTTVGSVCKVDSGAFDGFSLSVCFDEDAPASGEGDVLAFFFFFKKPDEGQC